MAKPNPATETTASKTSQRLTARKAGCEGQLVAQPSCQQQPENLNPSLRCPACYLLTWLMVSDTVGAGIWLAFCTSFCKSLAVPMYSAPESRVYSLASLSMSRHAAPINAPQVPGTRRTLPWSRQMSEFAQLARSDFHVSRGHSEHRRACSKLPQ